MIYKRQFFLLFFFCLIHSYLSLCTPSSQQCGCSQVKPLLTQSKIVGGYTARTNSWPWIVSIRQLSSNASSSTSPGSAFCGGTLISDRYVLTAAHCFYNIKPSQYPLYFVVVGAQYRNDTNPVRLTIKSVIIHSKYDPSTYENDITLLELTYRVDLTDPKIGFICLPPSNVLTYPDASINATAIGWGKLQQSGSSSYTLQQVQLPIIDYTNQYCFSAVYDSSVQFCAGFIQGGKDTCQGDSGGPLMAYNSNSDTWNLAGITSYGSGCAVAENPGVYTRVSMFVDWINGYTSGSNSQSKASINLIPNEILLFSCCMSLFFLKITFLYLKY
ncbi:unnamed protein product [Adineta steineri]|uniref:Peptidase S1 domain-containing protein n=2 Tax=Adineta steineri TaxID=433720 RepID=A0A818KTZ7_9BILA|nr:unnamed protein product [Adineta steineri]